MFNIKECTPEVWKVIEPNCRSWSDIYKAISILTYPDKPTEECDYCKGTEWDMHEIGDKQYKTCKPCGEDKVSAYCSDYAVK